MDKEEINKIEKWQKERELLEKEKYGYSSLELINMLKKENNKKNKTLDKVGLIFSKIIKIILILFAIVIIIFALIYLKQSLSNAKNSVNIDAINAVESMYDIKVKVVNKEVDDKGNGKYYLKASDNNINFTAIKLYGSLKEDYSAQCLKYYFNLWNSDEKKDFKVIEKIENDILKYELYIDDFNNIDSATKKILSFTNFCGNEFKPYWNVYILKNNERIYPFDNFNESEDEVLKTTREEYNNLLKNKMSNNNVIMQ